MSTNTLPILKTYKEKENYVRVKHYPHIDYRTALNKQLGRARQFLKYTSLLNCSDVGKIFSENSKKERDYI